MNLLYILLGWYLIKLYLCSVIKNKHIMTFKNEFPKKEVTIVTDKKVGCLMSDNKATIHYRDYKGYLDTVQHITLEGCRNAWHEIKNDFFYDTLMDKVKDTYIDSFNRTLNVTIKVK